MLWPRQQSLSLHGTVGRIEGLISSGQYDEALGAIQRIVDRVFCEPASVARVFGSPELDRLCQLTGARARDARRGRGDCIDLKSGRGLGGDPVAVFVVSRIQASGGLTAALIDLIRQSPPSDRVVIITGTCGPMDRRAVSGRFGGLERTSIEYAPVGSRLEKLHWIQQRLEQIRPSSVWLLNHHQDSVAVAAVQPDEGYRIRFYHHGDHHICLGVHLPAAEHVDPHPMGFHNCRSNLGVENNRYLPLVAADMGYRAAGVAVRPDSAGLVTCTAGGYNKVEVPYHVQYPDVVPELVRATGGRHIHIGRLSPLARWRIHSGLRRRGIPLESFVYLPYVASVWRALQELKVDLYVASFPYGGGRTLVEVMGAGVPAIVHEHCTSRMLGGFDMAYDGAFVWQSADQLLQQLRTLDRPTLEREGCAARMWYERFHREEILKAALADELELEVPELRAGYRPNALAQGLETTGYCSMGGVFRRVIWRNYRRASALVGRRRD